MYLTREVKDLYDKKKNQAYFSRNRKTLEGGMLLHALIGRITIMEMIILPKAVYRFEAILTQIPILCLTVEQRKRA